MSVIEEIKGRLDIVDVVSDYVNLQKSGRNFKALCPFHTEKTPSFFVFPERQTWHCFGSCGTGGDVFSFLMKKEGIDFGEALKSMADRAGVRLMSKQREQAREKASERLYNINEDAAHYYHSLLLDEKIGASALQYLEGRGISRKTIGDFELGYSPDSWDSLLKHLSDKGYKTDEMIKAGVLHEKEGGGVRDLFHNRLMIPIRNMDGRVVGFGARTLDGSDPKYLNSPQTPIFDKSGLLYGLDRAKGPIREQNLAIIVEGYMDVLTAHQYSITNVVAPMGTSLTEKQIGIIKRLTKDIALALDADAAGEQATLRDIGEIKRALGTSVDYRTRGWLEAGSRFQGSLNIIPMPHGKDPDEIIKDNPDDWRLMVQNAQSVMDYLFEAIISKLDLSKERDKYIAVDQLAPAIAELIHDAIEKEIFLKKCSTRIGLDDKILASRVAQISPTAKEKHKREVVLPATRTASHPLEEYCLSLLLQNPWLQDRGVALSPEHFEGTENRELFLAWLNTTNTEILHDTLDTTLQEHLDALMNKSLPPATEHELEMALADSVRRLWEQRLRRIKALEETLISEAESEGDVNIIRDQVEALLQKSLEPTSQLKDLFERAKRERKGVHK
jgi:DNA primase